jgi:hypothetical protein
MTMAQKQQKWQKALQKVAQITDKIGMPVDERIIETVAILTLLGFKTSMSCEGHVDRVTEGPYVIFDSPKAMKAKLLFCL